MAKITKKDVLRKPKNCFTIGSPYVHSRTQSVYIKMRECTYGLPMVSHIMMQSIFPIFFKEMTELI